MSEINTRDISQELGVSTTYLNQRGWGSMTTAQRVEWLKDYADDLEKVCEEKLIRARIARNLYYRYNKVS